MTHQFSYENFLVPPTKTCLTTGCDSQLTKNHKCTQVIVCTPTGLETASCYNYRCRKCKSNYDYEMYGGKSNMNYYSQERPYIKATQVLYIDRIVMKHWQQLSMHSQVSFDSMAVCYNATFKNECTQAARIFSSYVDDDDV